MTTINGPLGGGTAGSPTYVYGNTSGDDFITIYGFYNNVYSQGANDQITDTGGGDSNIYLGGNNFNNSFTNVDDTVNLNNASNDLVTTGAYKLTGSTLTIQGGAGYNTVSINNDPAYNNIFMDGYNNNITVNGNATNNVGMGAGNDRLTVNGPVVSPNAYTTTVTDAGEYSSVTGGNEKFNITGGQGYDAISIGAGDNYIQQAGQEDSITFNAGTYGVGSNVVSMLVGPGNQAGYTTVTFKGLVVNTAIGPWITESISLGGIGNLVNETTTAGKISSRNITITGSTGNSTFLLGNGDDSVTGTGSDNRVVAGTPTNEGNPAANGYGDYVSITSGHSNTIILGDGPNKIVASTGAANTDGNDDTITAGNGANTVTANGTSLNLLLGNGANTVQANGDDDNMKFGSGSNVVTANGNGDNIFFDPGSNTLTATGDGDTIVSTTGGSGTFTIGSDSNLTLTGPSVGSTINTKGPQDVITLVKNASATINDGPINPTSGLTVDISATGGSYTGTTVINHLQDDPNAVINLTGFGTTNLAQFLESDGAGGTLINLVGHGGGTIDLTNIATISTGVGLGPQVTIS